MTVPLWGRAGNSPALLIFALFSLVLCVLFSRSTAWAQDSDWQNIQLSVKKKEYRRAERQISRYVLSHPDQRNAYLLGGRIARKIHHPDEGLSILEKGLGRYPSDPALLRLKAELLMERGDLTPAKASSPVSPGRQPFPPTKKRK